MPPLSCSPRTVVAMMSGRTVIMEAWREKVAAILMLGYRPRLLRQDNGWTIEPGANKVIVGRQSLDHAALRANFRIG
jgi:hypothetical protein